MMIIIKGYQCLKISFRNRNISQTLYQEYEKKLLLKDGSKILTLEKLLHSLEASESESKLIIEIKGTANIEHMTTFFGNNQHLMANVPVVMSFSPTICFSVNKILKQTTNSKVLLLMKLDLKKNSIDDVITPKKTYLSLNLASPKAV